MCSKKRRSKLRTHYTIPNAQGLQTLMNNEKNNELHLRDIADDSFLPCNSMNSVDLFVAFELLNKGKLTILDLKSVRMPWLNERMKAESQLIMDEIISCTKTEIVDCQKTLMLFQQEIAKQFNKQFGCRITFGLETTIFSSHTIIDGYLTNIPQGIVVYSDEDIHKNTQDVTTKDINNWKISKVKPGTEIKVYFQCNLGVHLNTIVLKLGEEWESKVAFDDDLVAKKEYAFSFSSLSPKEYNTANKYKVFVVTLTFNNKQLDFNLPIQLDDEISEAAAEHVVLFVDMGSTYTKYIMIRPDAVTLWDASSIVNKYGPSPTKDLCDQLGCGGYDKCKLAGMGSNRFSLWLTNLINALSDRIYQEHNRRIDQIYWSFPRLKNRIGNGFFEQVSMNVSDRIEQRIPGGCVLCPEDRSLRYMFESVLKNLSLKGEEKKKEVEWCNSQRQDQIERRYADERKEYENRWFWYRWTHDAPTRRTFIPEPFDNYFKKCLEIGCAKGLKKFILIDAGGFSVDVYAEKDGNEIIAESFEAGGNAMTEAYRSYLCQEGENVSFEVAEREKRKVLSAPQDHPDGEILKRLTQNIYGNVANVIADKIAAQSAESGFVVLFSGAASQNEFFKDLLQQKLKSARVLTSDKLGWQDTERICNVFLSNQNIGTSDNDFIKFMAVSQTTGARRGAFDIAGGMIFQATAIPIAEKCHE